jgi:hypothetical protein
LPLKPFLTIRFAEQVDCSLITSQATPVARQTHSRAVPQALTHGCSEGSSLQTQERSGSCALIEYIMASTRRGNGGILRKQQVFRSDRTRSSQQLPFSVYIPYIILYHNTANIQYPFKLISYYSANSKKGAGRMFTPVIGRAGLLVIFAMPCSQVCLRLLLIANESRVRSPESCRCDETA